MRNKPIQLKVVTPDSAKIERIESEFKRGKIEVDPFKGSLEEFVIDLGYQDDFSCVVN